MKAKAFVIILSMNGNRAYLGKNTDTGEYCWVSEWIVAKPMADVHPIVFKQEQYAKSFAGRLSRTTDQEISVMELNY